MIMNNNKIIILLSIKKNSGKLKKKNIALKKNVVYRFSIFSDGQFDITIKDISSTITVLKMIYTNNTSHCSSVLENVQNRQKKKIRQRYLFYNTSMIFHILC